MLNSVHPLPPSTARATGDDYPTSGWARATGRERAGKKKNAYSRGSDRGDAPSMGWAINDNIPIPDFRL